MKLKGSILSRCGSHWLKRDPAALLISNQNLDWVYISHGRLSEACRSHNLMGCRR